MGFFNEDFFKELDNDIDVEADDDTFSNNVVSDSEYYQDNINLEVNKRNQETFKDLMDNASYKTDDWWDMNNPVVKIILLVLFIIIVIGLLYYIIGWISLVS